VHCGADLAGMARLLAQRRRERLQTLLWSCAVASWAVAALCLEYAARPELAPKLRRILYLVGGGIIAANLLAFWIATRDERGR
jgi:hypothetical protein